MRRLYPFRHRWLGADGTRIHYVDEGPRDGATILLVHGNPVWSFVWREQVRALAGEGFRVVAPDHVGFGLSDKPGDVSYYSLDRHVRNMERLCDELGLRDVTVVVHDWGGPIGLGWVTEHPDRVKGLLVLDTWAWIPSKAPKLPLPYAIARTGLGNLLFDRWNLFLPLALRFGIGDRRLRPRAVMRAYRFPFRGTSAAGILAFMRGIPSRDGEPNAPRMRRIEERLPTLRCPKRLLWAENDPVLPLGAARKFQRIWPDAPLEIVAGARHFLSEEAPQRVTDAIRALARP